MSKIKYEKHIVDLMIQIYCRKKHANSSGLCSECDDLLNYAQNRLDKCTYSENKPACANCPVHCYKLEMRNKIRQVMRFSGPRMLIYHPMDFVRHYLLKKI